MAIVLLLLDTSLNLIGWAFKFDWMAHFHIDPKLASCCTVSVAFCLQKRVVTKESKFGLAMVLETTNDVSEGSSCSLFLQSISPSCPSFSHLFQGGGYVLGFHMDPVDKLKDTVKEIGSLHRVSAW